MWLLAGGTRWDGGDWRLTDRLGRKKVMIGTILLMGISTFLVGKSLMRQRTDSNGSPRYVMMRVIREYALEVGILLVHEGDEEQPRQVELWSTERGKLRRRAQRLPDDRRLRLRAAR